MTVATTIAIERDAPAQPHPLRAGTCVGDAEFAHIRRHLMLEGCKWDPQVGDVSTLAPFPLLIDRAQWNILCDLSERLTSELRAAELELLARPRLHRVLAIPHRVRDALRDIERLGETPAAVRVMRFDFHWTTGGWQISEVNSDVPGGFSESSEFTRLMCPLVPGTTTPGDPGARWADALARNVQPGDVALLAAPGFMEDQQVVSYLARQLQPRGFRTHLATPMQLRWIDGIAHLMAGAGDIPLTAIVRFYQAEWLTHLPRQCPWQRLVAGSITPVVNPAIAVLTESKRFPLVWNELKTPLPTWRRLLPETRDPRNARWRRDEGWLLKTAYCNTGDTVTARNLSTPSQWRAASIGAWLRPGHWIAQRRFKTIPIAAPIGDVYPCVGVYTIDGRAVGAYTRVAPRAVIDYRAIDAALLITEGIGVNFDPIYQAWAPEQATWSRWVKPVLFAHLESTVVQTTEVSTLGSPDDISWLPRADGSTAMVIDLPGAQSVLLGLALAGYGYAPVPLFNSVPIAVGTDLSSMNRPAVVDMSLIVSLLIMGAGKLRQLNFSEDAPPAFLLDVRRRGRGASLTPRTFDNRSVSLPTDFPSANFLLAQGVTRAVLVQEIPGPLETDLAHTLRRWQQAGIEILATSMTDRSAPHPIDVPRPPWFRHLWYGLLARFGLRRNPLGGYGGFIPEPSSSG